MIWNVLLQLRSELRRAENLENFSFQHSNKTKGIQEPTHVEVTRRATDKAIRLHFHNLSKPGASIKTRSTAPFEIQIEHQQNLLDDEISEIARYLPYALLPHYALSLSKTFAISHFAQTLDGRIATRTGDSKWIGNQENLLHAHKMRALCDAILVGASTLKTDQPLLSVRLVDGEDPIRIILGNSVSDIDLKDHNKAPALFINTVNSAQCRDQLTLKPNSEIIDAKAILNALYARGIYSIYIEGGAHTTSNFLRSQALDQVQIHLSPRILGSGTTGFAFEGIDTIDQAIDFQNPRFLNMGNHVMFVGEIKHP